MNQIPDEAAERVLGTIREAIDLDARDQRAEASRVLKQMVDEFPGASILTATWDGSCRAAGSTGRRLSTVG